MKHLTSVVLVALLLAFPLSRAQSGDKGAGAEATATIMPGTSIYQFTEAGVALQATLKGTKFWANEFSTDGRPKSS